ncbi:hypothetical protein CUMW_133950 [Citrus unshiu]|nr:hypothetical protein CUMW_133950 [Citrus unshiu]
MSTVYMDSCHQQRNQMPFPHYYHPSHNNVPPHVMMDHSKPPLVYESWPHGNNYGYSMSPSFSSFSPAPPFYYRGHHPPFIEPYPVHFAPPPHHAMEQQRYEYNKDAHRDNHCCGCLNHMSNQRIDKGVKIEEQEPDVAKKSDSVVPLQSKSYPYPIAWISPAYMKKNDEPRRSFESEVAEQEKVPCNTKSNENMEPSEGTKRVEWLDEHEKRKQNEQNENGMKQFSYPEGEVEKKDRKEKNVASISAEESPSDSKFMQVKPPESDERMKNFEPNEDFSDDKAKSSQMMEGTANKKTIPVREDHSDSAEKGVAADNSFRTSKMRQSSSPPKTSKLPPVCLRLEPLSKKKNGNGNSRSPSPPGLKRHIEREHATGSQSADDSFKRRGDGNPKKTEKKALAVVDGKNCENKNEHLKSGSHMENSIKLSTDLEDGATEEDKLNDSAESVNGECMAKEKNLSDDQAAVLIQSAYRGFEVRKLEPLKKLKQMVEVRDQAAEIRMRIQALESSSDLLKNEKERVLIGEMIMRTLLKLDTIQTSETALSDTEVQGRCEVRELPLRNSMESQVGESASDMVQFEATNGGVDVSQAVLTENQGKDIMHPHLQPTSSEELTGAQLQDSFDEPKAMNEAKIDGVKGGIHAEDNLEAQATELPLILDDEEQPLQKLKNSESSRKGKSENVDGEVKLHVLAGSTLPADVDNVDEIGKTARNVDSEINLAAELPIGALEEDLSFENKGSETNSETNLVAELPVGVLEGDLAIENKESEIENLVAELPVGVLEEGEAKESEIGKDKGSSIGEARYNGVVMVDELSGNAVLEMEENLPLSSIEGKVRSDDEVCKNEGKDGGRIDDDQLPSPESAGISVSPQALEVTNEDVQLQGVDGNKEGRVLEKEQQYGEPESMIDIESRMDEASGSEITTEDTIAATTTSQMSADEKDIVMEENAKLREMMEKLMEAGKEQLTVISQLTGRVKDLERKLSRKRKLRGPRRYKRATQSFRQNSVQGI